MSASALEHLKTFRGDKRSETIDIHYHIDHDELRKGYLRYMPNLGT